MLRHVWTFNSKTTLNSFSTVQSACAFVQLTSTFAFPCSHMSGGGECSQNEKKKQKKLTGMFGILHHVIHLQTLKRCLRTCECQRRIGGLEKQTFNRTAEGSFFSKRSSSLTTLPTPEFCRATDGREQNGCKSNRKFAELTRHFAACDVSIGDYCRLDRVRVSETAESRRSVGMLYWWGCLTSISWVGIRRSQWMWDYMKDTFRIWRGVTQAISWPLSYYSDRSHKKLEGKNQLPYIIWWYILV